MIDRADLALLDAVIEEALRTGDQSRLTVLGYGELSLVVGWPSDAPVMACKRLPVFPDAERAERYRGLMAQYLVELVGRGVQPVHTETVRIDRPDGTALIYAVQPLLAPEHLAVEVLREALGGADPAGAQGLVERIVDTILGATDERIGVDGQITNWAVEDGALLYFDVTTPFLQEDGRSLLDLDVFLAALPAALRRPVRRFLAAEVLARYHRPRDVLLDFASNLGRFGFADLRPLVVELSMGRVEPPLNAADITRYYRSDSRIWRFLLAIRKLDRIWQRRVRRRPYPYLLPPSSKW